MSLRPTLAMFALAGALTAEAQTTARARALGIPFDFGAPGPLDAITDVAGLEVGHVTLIEGAHVRTGVTAILPRGKGPEAAVPVYAGVFSLNGNGEMTGVHWIEEAGLLEGPLMLTNTADVGVVRDAVMRYGARRFGPAAELWTLPLAAETWDLHLSDMYGRHVTAEHAQRAIESAAGGPVAEGGVGGGTGMICFEFKGGIGTASRALDEAQGGYTVGVLVQANFGRRAQLRVAGLPVGRELRGELVYSKDQGSIIVVVATDAPLLPHQLKRLARRAGLGLARTGSVAGNSSGDLFVAFSTANRPAGGQQPFAVRTLPPDAIDPLFEAVVGATEEAIVNALVAGRDMTGRAGHVVRGLPHAELQAILRRHGVLQEPVR